MEEKVKYIEKAFYMALPTLGQFLPWTQEAHADLTNWVAIEYRDGKFYKTRNLIPYNTSDFDEIVPMSIFHMLQAYKRKQRALKTAAENYQGQVNATKLARKNLSNNQSILDELLKSIGTVVDQISGDMVLTGNDLESTNHQIVKLYTMLKERGGIE